MLNWLPDKLYLKLLFYRRMGVKLRLNNPITFNEKLQWLKLYDRRSEYTHYVDKYAVRDYIINEIGDEYLIPLIGVYNSFDEIDFSTLPNQFVLKCTHDSGGVVICKDKSKLNLEDVEEKINTCLSRNFFYPGREWPYKNIKPRIICEQYMVDESTTELKDYKIFCFAGEPKLIQVDYNRFINHKRNFYDTKWKYINASIQYPNDPTIVIRKPELLDNLLVLARKLSKNYPHVRVDFYYIKGKIYFGEMTFYHGSGYEKFQPEEFGELLGSWLELPTEKVGN